jgi:hypothetical protein
MLVPPRIRIKTSHSRLRRFTAICFHQTISQWTVASAAVSQCWLPFCVECALCNNLSLFCCTEAHQETGRAGFLSELPMTSASTTAKRYCCWNWKRGREKDDDDDEQKRGRGTIRKEEESVSPDHSSKRVRI